MGTPITWRNINAPNFSESNRLMESAMTNLNQGLGGIQTAIDDNLDGQKQVWDQTQKVNTDDALAQIMAAGTLDQHQALSEQFTPEALANRGEGQQVDAKAILGALNSRDDQIRQEQLTQFNYEDTLLDRKQAPIKNEFDSLVAAGRFKDAQALLDREELRGEGAMAQSLADAQRADSDRKHMLWQRGNEIKAYKETQDNKARVKSIELAAGQIVNSDMSHREKLEAFGDRMTEMKIPLTEQYKYLDIMRDQMTLAGQNTQQETRDYAKEVLQTKHAYEKEVAAQDAIITDMDTILTNIPEDMKFGKVPLDRANLNQTIREEMPLIEDAWGGNFVPSKDGGNPFTGSTDQTDGESLNYKMGAIIDKYMYVVNKGLQQDHEIALANAKTDKEREALGEFVPVKEEELDLSPILSAVKVVGRYDTNDEGKGKLSFHDLNKALFGIDTKNVDQIDPKSVHGELAKAMRLHKKQVDALSVKRKASSKKAQLRRDYETNQLGLRDKYKITEGNIESLFQSLR